MIEQEWLACNDPVAMLKLLDGRHWVIDNRRNRAGVDSFLLRTPSDRQLRLFACACRRQVPGLRWDGQSSGWQRMEEHPEAEVLANEVGPHTIPAIEHARLLLGSQENPSQAEMANLLREIIGNPFRPVTIAPSWLTWNDGTIPALAEQAYQERVETGELDPARLAILADALEEAGCDNEDILRHLRGQERCSLHAFARAHGNEPVLCGECGTGCGWRPLSGPHVRGCWVVDLLRGAK